MINHTDSSQLWPEEFTTRVEEIIKTESEQIELPNGLSKGGLRWTADNMLFYALRKAFPKMALPEAAAELQKATGEDLVEIIRGGIIRAAETDEYMEERCRWEHSF